MEATIKIIDAGTGKILANKGQIVYDSTSRAISCAEDWYAGDLNQLTCEGYIPEIVLVA